MTDKWITAAAFARLVGCSRSNVRQSIQRGRIAASDLRRDGRHQWINTRAIADWQATSASDLPALAWGHGSGLPSDNELEEALEPINQWIESREPDWEAIAARLNNYLGASWPGVPFNAEQTATLALLLSMAEEGG